MPEVNSNKSENTSVPSEFPLSDQVKRRLEKQETATTTNAEKPSSRIGNIYCHNSHEIQTRPSTHIFTRDNIDDEEEATWGDVARACCFHDQREWLYIGLSALILLLCLYFFLVALDLLGTAFAVVGGCTASSMLGSDTNPMAGVMIGIVATSLLQSSSTTTAIVVSLVSGGLDVKQGIYIVMGANVGTSVTSMMVSLAHMGNNDELERAFAASSVNWVFKFLTVIPLLILEVTTHYLYWLTKAMLPTQVGDGDNWEGPIKQIVSPLTDIFLIANKDLIDQVAAGNKTCSAAYPVVCDGGLESYATCEAGLIGCNKDTGKCPLFFDQGAEAKDDKLSGWFCIILSIVILMGCLIGLVSLLRSMLLGASRRIIYKATDINEYVSMAVGCGVTILVQSSSITTSTLVPLAGIGLLPLEQIYPLTLGADIGTTFTALMAAMVSSSIESLQIALAHLFFNLTGIIIWYPIPFMRAIPLAIAKRLGRVTRVWRSFPPIFIFLAYLVLPLVILGISYCFETGGKGMTALGVFFIAILLGGGLWFWIWWRFRDGGSKFKACLRRRQRRSSAIRELADDLDYIKCDIEYTKNEIGRLKDFAGFLSATDDSHPIEIVGFQEAKEAERFADEGESVSMFHSCRSKPWRGVFISNSTKSSLRRADLSQQRLKQ